MHVVWDVPKRVVRAAKRVPTRHDPRLVEQALARYAAGECRSQIAVELSIHPYTLSAWVRRSGLPVHRHRPSRLTDREIAEVADAVRLSGSIRGAAGMLGRDESTVRHVLRRHAPDVLTSGDETWRPKRCDPQLPVEPLARLLDEKVARGMLITQLAAEAGTIERRVNAIRNREYKTVRLSTADRLCMAAGTHLSLVYPVEDSVAA